MRTFNNGFVNHVFPPKEHDGQNSEQPQKRTFDPDRDARDAFFDSSIFIHDVREVLALETTGGVWPPTFQGHAMHVIDPFDLPFLMTMILLLSAAP